MTFQEIIDLGLNKGIQEIELYVETSNRKTIKVFHGNLESLDNKELFSVSIRGIVNNKMSYVSIESTDENTVNEALDNLISSANQLTAPEKEIIFKGGAEYPTVVAQKSDINEYSNAQIIKLLADMEAKTLAYDEKIKQIPYCQLSYVKEQVNIVNSNGVNLEKQQEFVTVIDSAFAVEGDNSNVGYYGQSKINLKEIDIPTIIEKAAKPTLEGLNCGFVKSGAYPVVFSSEVATDILRGFMSNFSGEAAMRKMTQLMDKKGTKVFGDNITFIDDPLSDKALIKSAFDDEAVPCKKKVVVENGVFNGFLHTQKTAAFFNEELTGNGFKAGEQITPQPTNFYLVPGKGDAEDLFEGIEEGIFITDVNGLHAGINAVAGSFNIQSKGFMIRNGKKAEAVTLFVVSGDFYDMFNNITAIADDIDGELVGVNCPSIRVKQLMVSGK